MPFMVLNQSQDKRRTNLMVDSHRQRGISSLQLSLCLDAGEALLGSRSSELLNNRVG